MGKDLIPMRIQVQESQVNADPRPNPWLPARKRKI